MISFVFYAHTKRLNNLSQTLYCLRNRENKLTNYEIIIVFQDTLIEIEGCKCFTLGMDTYNKSMLCNFGVKQASHSIIALLDSDRILPPDYFYENALELEKKQFVTTSIIVKLMQPVPDNFHLYQKYEHYKELRSYENQFRQKNLFSGNTLFFAQDYMDSGGMDENFFGYGYADNDMTKNVLSKGYKQKFCLQEEIHLQHEQSMCYKGEFLKDFQIFNALNVMRYSIKWSYRDSLSDQIIFETLSKISKYPEELQGLFWRLYKKYNNEQMI